MQPVKAAATDAPLVSVLMTAYNRERYIADAIRSVLSSTYSNFELIVVDDGSTDGTLEIAQHFAEQDSRIRVYRNEQNLGDYPNRNRAAALAGGKYLKYVDSDDVLYPHGLEVMVQTMERFPAAAWGLSVPPRADAPCPLQLAPEELYRDHFEGSGLLGRGPLAAIIRADAFEQVGGFHGFHVAGDLALWLKLAALFPVVLMPPGLTWWRQHAEQEYARGVAAEVYPALVYRVHIEALTSPHCPLSTRQRSKALARVRRAHALSVLGLLRRGRFAGALRFLRERNAAAAHPAQVLRTASASAEAHPR